MVAIDQSQIFWRFYPLAMKIVFGMRETRHSPMGHSRHLTHGKGHKRRDREGATDKRPTFLFATPDEADVAETKPTS